MPASASTAVLSVPPGRATLGTSKASIRDAMARIVWSGTSSNAASTMFR